GAVAFVQEQIAAARGRGAAVLRWREQLCDPVARPAAGDAVLFIQRETRGTEWHIGTVLFGDDGLPWVLHTHGGLAASVLEPLAACRMRGLRIEGFYRWR
ncbi:MAG: hypothetical protein KIS72_08555, partial [Luteimonas sp.]|nr:hypothetical protein [Luteimonas sp.]